MEKLLEVKDLRIRFRSDFGVKEVTDGISFSLAENEALGLVGESGCGKSVTAMSLMGLLSKNGSVGENSSAIFDGKDLFQLSEAELDELRGSSICMIYQDSLSSLNPVLTIGSQMIEAICRHREPDKEQAKELAITYMKQAGLSDPEKLLKKYPHQLSGGMRQRVMIAMALSCSPKLLLADEPTTALDVTIQAQIMDTIREIRRNREMAMILITHDIGLIAEMVDRVIVMYAGQIVEETDVYELFANPLHPYTKALLAATPGIYDDPEHRLASIPGAVPENYTDIHTCRFYERCSFACEACKVHQELREVRPSHVVRCMRSQEVAHG
ncbi:MAG: ABC transporter ATP-binding protein [Solobacterium sp.]|nr:ABC transporter ATP-binding protein [Solobacterium sp.]